MDAGLWVLTGAVVVLALCVVLLAVLVLRQGRMVARLEAERSAPSTSGTDQWVRRAGPIEHPVDRDAEHPEFVITHLGEPEPPEAEQRTVPDRVVLSATLGEPLVKAMAFSHGVRRALSAETRNRIRFEVRREVKRSRKQRRREMREAWRQMKADRAAGAPATAAQDGRDVA